MSKSKSAFRDTQILLAIKELNKCTIMDIFYYCINNYPNFEWYYQNIWNSINRLLRKNKIKQNVFYENSFYYLNRTSKMFKRQSKVKLYSLRL